MTTKTVAVPSGDGRDVLMTSTKIVAVPSGEGDGS